MRTTTCRGAPRKAFSRKVEAKVNAGLGILNGDVPSVSVEALTVRWLEANGDECNEVMSPLFAL